MAADSQEIFKNYLAETLDEMTSRRPNVNSGGTPMTIRGNLRASPLLPSISRKSPEKNIEFMKDIARGDNYEIRRRAGSSDYNYDAIPSIKNNPAGRRMGLNSSIINQGVGPFRSDLIAGSFSIGGVEFDFRDLQNDRKEINEALFVLITELLLFINDIKGNDKYRTALESYVSDVDTLPQSALKKNVSLPVLDTNWAYPGPVYRDKKLPYTYGLKQDDESYCGRCFNYVGGSRVGKCHRYNNAVTPYYMCASYTDRNTSFHAGDYKGRFRATNEQGSTVFYTKGDVVKFKSKTYIATKKTSAAQGSPIHTNSGWTLIDEEILDGGEF